MPTDWTTEDFEALARALVEEDRSALVALVRRPGPYGGLWHNHPHVLPCWGCRVSDVIEPDGVALAPEMSTDGD